MNNYFFFGLDKPSCFILLFGNLLVALVVVVIVFVVVVAVVDKFDSYCCSRISKRSLISSSFKLFLFFAGNIFESEDVEGSCSLTSDVDLSESVGEKMKML